MTTRRGCQKKTAALAFYAAKPLILTTHLQHLAAPFYGGRRIAIVLMAHNSLKRLKRVPASEAFSQAVDIAAGAAR